MEWIKTTFGELKAGDVYVMSSTVASSVDRRGASDEIISDYLPDVTVYRLVSPEREALEKIVALYHKPDMSWPTRAHTMRLIATAALEGGKL